MSVTAEKYKYLTYEQLEQMPSAEMFEISLSEEGRKKIEQLKAENAAKVQTAGPREYQLETLTFQDVVKMPASQLKYYRRKDDWRIKIDELIQTENARKAQSVVDADKAAADKRAAERAADEVHEKELRESEAAQAVETEEAAKIAARTPEEIAAEEAAAQVAEAARVAAEEAAAQAAVETARQAALTAEAEAQRRAEEARPKRFVYEFQARDEQGNPIGNKTHLEATSQEELDKKREIAYENAVRAIARLKRQKPTFKKEELIKETTQEELDAAAADLTSEDPAVRAAAVRKLATSELEKDRYAARYAEANANASNESLKFRMAHLTDYNNCQANNELMAEFIKNENLEWTADNLEIAFNNLESQLAPMVTQEAVVPEPAVIVEVNPPAVAAPAALVVPAAATVPAAPAASVAPAAAAPVASVVPAPPAANPAPAAPVRRAGVNAGVIPGETLTGVAPIGKKGPVELTLKDFAKMSAEEIKRRHKLDPKLYDKINALIAARKQSR